MELGFELAVAQVMVQTMNKAIINMHFPETMHTMQSSRQKFHYAIIEGKQIGPLSDIDLSKLIAEKRIIKETYIWKPGLTNWKIAENFPEILKLIDLLSSPFKQNP
jgi:hypothetical protein